VTLSALHYSTRSDMMTIQQMNKCFLLLVCIIIAIVVVVIVVIN